MCSDVCGQIGTSRSVDTCKNNKALANSCEKLAPHWHCLRTTHLNETQQQPLIAAIWPASEAVHVPCVKQVIPVRGEGCVTLCKVTRAMHTSLGVKTVTRL
jgi:hypothetical protein